MTYHINLRHCAKLIYIFALLTKVCRGSGAKEHSSHLSHINKRNTDIEQKNWKPCWVRFPGSEKLGASRNGGMERNFPVIPIFRNCKPTSRGIPKISEWNSGKCLFQSLPNPEFPEFLVEWKAPKIWKLEMNFKWTAYRKPYWKCLVKYSAHFVAYSSFIF